MKLMNVLIISWLVVVYSQFSFKPQRIVIDNIQGVCRDVKNVPIAIANFRPHFTSNGKQLIDNDIIVSRDISNNLKVRFTLDKCRSKESPDTCMKYTTVNLNHVCKVMTMPNKVLSDYFHKLEPPISCPMKKGHYRCRNCSLNVDLFTVFPTKDAYWRIKTELLDKTRGTILACILTDASIR